MFFISKKAIETFYQRTLQYSPSELNSFLAQDIPMFWQEYLAPLIIYPIFGLSISSFCVLSFDTTYPTRSDVYSWGIFNDYTPVYLS